jgi:hypothetical protein
MAIVSKFPQLSADELDRHVAVNFGVHRRLAAWAPLWLRRLWPRWPAQESDRAFRKRLVRIPRCAPRGTADGIREGVADVLRCRPERVVVEECGPQEFTVGVPRRLTAKERKDVHGVIDILRPALTRCTGVREGR